MARILIADDALPMRVLLGGGLRRDGPEVLEAADGNAALDGLRRDRPDVAMLDLHMPGLSALDVCNATRAEPCLATGGLIILSGDDVAAAEWRAAAAGSGMKKPCRPAELLRAISDLV